jgi:hypothetical protein
MPQKGQNGRANHMIAKKGPLRNVFFFFLELTDLIGTNSDLNIQKGEQTRHHGADFADSRA